MLPRQTIKPTKVRVVGGFDSGPCKLCRTERPCDCGSREACRCECGRCLYPYPLPDDGPLEDR